MPTDAAAIALQHLAHLLCSVSEAMHIPLLHSVHPFDSIGCVTISPASRRQKSYVLSPLMPSLDLSRPQEFLWTAVRDLSNREHSIHYSGVASHSVDVHKERTFPGPMPDVQAILSMAANRKRTASDVMHDMVVNQHFTDALDLLYENVITLSIQAGVSTEELWPKECILLNLWTLYEHFLELIADGVDELVMQSATTSSLPLVSDPNPTSCTEEAMYSSDQVISASSGANMKYSTAISANEVESDWALVNDD